MSCHALRIGPRALAWHRARYAFRARDRGATEWTSMPMGAGAASLEASPIVPLPAPFPARRPLQSPDIPTGGYPRTARPRVVPAGGWSARRLDVLLALLERRDMSPTELRVLLAVVHRERSLRDLAELFEKSGASFRRTARRLHLEGMLRQRHDDSGEPLFAITPRGLAAVKPLMTAARCGTR